VAKRIVSTPTVLKLAMPRISDLIDFIRMEADGSCWDDLTYRAYDLDRTTGLDMLKRARRSLGYSRLADLRSDVAGLGYLGPLQGALARWYAWHRLRTGDVKKWPLRVDRSRPKRNKT
jgi:hypothetical protein